MSRFSAIMHLKEQAEEDIYFARRDRDLIRRLRKEQAATKRSIRAKPQRRPPAR